MWTTRFKHSEGVVEEMTHDFGNKVKVVTNLTERTIKRYHGGVLVREFTLDPQVMYYVRFLENVGNEVNVPMCQREDKVTYKLGERATW